MIEPASGSTAAASPFRELHARKVFRMTHSSRMAGSVPVWETPRGAQQRVEQTLTAVVTGDDSRSASLKGALAYQNPRPESASEPLQEFGFGDLVDMVNPLQQLPVIGHIYREITGDTIKPISQIVGGALYGGPMGAAAGLANAIIREETGQDIAGNALALAQGDIPEWKNTTESRQSPSAWDSPEIRLSRASQEIESAAYRDLPASLLGFTDSGAAAHPSPQASAPATPAPTNRASWRKHEHYND